jgi:hypothetical protein
VRSVVALRLSTDRSLHVLQEARRHYHAELEVVSEQHRHYVRVMSKLKQQFETQMEEVAAAPAACRRETLLPPGISRAVLLTTAGGACADEELPALPRLQWPAPSAPH